MNSARVLGALAMADFRERTRRPGYLVTLAVTVALGYAAVPPASSVWVIFNAGGYRGIDNSAYVGTATALAGSLWLMFGGFYVVRSAVARDEQTSVGQILATTRLRRITYLFGKFLSNLMVLVSMAAALAATALVLQLVRGESTTIDPAALLLPFVVLCLPVLAVTAAAAVLVETVPVIRGGLGNIAWLVVWMISAIAGGGAPFGGLDPVSQSMREATAAQHLPAASEFSVGFTQVDRPLDTFTWTGLHLTCGFIRGRVVIIAVAILLAVLPAMWFTRFDPARASTRRAQARLSTETLAVGDETTPVAATHAAPPPRPLAYRHLAPGASRPKPATGRLLAGQFRILIQGTAWWWWLVVAAINIAALVVPADLVQPAGAAAALLLSAAWIWPVLIWSRLGSQSRENGVETLLGAYPSVYRQVAADWTAGLTLTALVGLGPLLRAAASSDGAVVAAWIAGALFIPSLAILLGTASRSHLPLQVLYVALWYASVNQVAAADYMGTVLDNHGHPAGPSPILTASAAVVMLAITFALRAARHITRR